MPGTRINRKLRNFLRLDEIDMISLVDRGDNPEAHVMIHKRAGDESDPGGEGDTMDEAKKSRVGFAREFLKHLGLGKDDLADDPDDGGDPVSKNKDGTDPEVLKRLDTLERDNAALRGRESIAVAKTAAEVDEAVAKIGESSSLDEAALGELRNELAPVAKAHKDALEKASADEDVAKFREKLPVALRPGFDQLDDDARGAFMKSYSEPGNDPVAKALADTTVALEKANDRIARLEADDLRRDVAKRIEPAVEFGVIEKADEAVDEIVKLYGASPDAADAMIERYLAIAKRVETSGLFETLGKDGGEPSDVEKRVESAVEKYRAANPGVSKEQALAKVYEENPDLYDGGYLDDNPAQRKEVV